MMLQHNDWLQETKIQDREKIDIEIRTPLPEATRWSMRHARGMARNGGFRVSEPRYLGDDHSGGIFPPSPILVIQRQQTGNYVLHQLPASLILNRIIHSQVLLWISLPLLYLFHC